MSNAREIAQLGSVPSGRKNIIINGAMQVAQRGTSFTSLSTQQYTLDRFGYYLEGGGAGRSTVTQSSDAPSGFANSLKVDVTTADTPLASGQDYRIRYIVEAQDLQRLDYGSSGAKPITISFWVKSNKTGVYTLNIYEADSARIIGAEYTINSSNTWEKKEITFAGDTGGNINNDNGASMYIHWVLGCGSGFTSGTFATSWQAYSSANYFSSNQVNLFDSTSNEFYITGVQLEVGSVATEFEHRSYAEELALCQRYYWQLSGTSTHIGTGFWYDSAEWNQPIYFPQTLRAQPAITFSNNSNDFKILPVDISFNTWTNFQLFTGTALNLYVAGLSGGTAENAGMTRFMNSTAKITFDAEL